MFESIGRSFALVKTSWDLLMEDKKLLAFPVLSGVITLLVILSFVLPVVFFGTFLNTTGVAFYGILFLFYVVSYFVVIFFNTSLILCVNARLHGKEMSVSQGLSNAAQHVVIIMEWALISATIGLILHILEERSGIVGEIVLSIIGGVWSLVTFFVVPIFILEDKGVVDSVKESFSLIRKTWGESIVGAGSIMIIFIAIGVVGLLGVIGASFIGGVVFALAIVLFLILLVVLGTVASAMQGIFVTALYTYAKTGTIPAAFNPELIQNAFVPKQAGPGNI